MAGGLVCKFKDIIDGKGAILLPEEVNSFSVQAEKVALRIGSDWTEDKANEKYKV
jgi:hypothetical protein